MQRRRPHIKGTTPPSQQHAHLAQPAQRSCTQANPYAAAIAKRQEAEAEARAKAEAERPAPPPGSYQAQLAAMFAPDGGVAYKYRPEEWTREFEVPPMGVS